MNYEFQNQNISGPYAPALYRAQEILNRTENVDRERTSDPKLVTDQFRMYSFKIDACPHAEPHDIESCPYLHPGEKARRRDPRIFNYQALPCPDFRKSQCKRGDACPFAHGVFECWLHPAKYRTTLCKEGSVCTRSVCFFAHSLEELREPTPSSTFSSTATKTTADQPPQQQIHLPRIKTFAARCENNHPNSPGSILHQQCAQIHHNFSTGVGVIGDGLPFSTATTPAAATTTTTVSCGSSADTSRCGSPGATTIAAAMESLRQASMSLPSSVESSLASTPLISGPISGSIGGTTAATPRAGGGSYFLPASLDEASLFTDATEVSGDVAMAAAVALRAQQQQAAAAAAAAQAVLSRILQTAAATGKTVPLFQSSSSSSLTPSSLPSSHVEENQENDGEEFALQQLIAGLGL